MSKKLLGILLLALSYAVIGRLFVLLAIPPGYATAIFPSAGLAVVALLLFGLPILPGVFFGSLLLNLWIGFDNGASLLAVLPIALGVATGATLQAVAAFSLVRKFVAKPEELTLDTDVIKFMLFAGPVACVINASAGVSSLYFNQALVAENVSYAWFTWWVGDTLGVLVGAPLVFMLLAPVKGVWRKRRLGVGLPLLVLSAGLIWMFIRFSAWEIQQRENVFNENVKLTQEQFKFRLALNAVSLGAFERFFRFSDTVSKDEFKGFASLFLQEDQDIRAISWNPLLTAAQRESFELQLNRESAVPHIFNVGQDRNQPAELDDQYVVVQYIEPVELNKGALGLNVLSNPARKAALWQARDIASPVASAKITLAQTGEDGVLVFYPVYQGAFDTVEKRRENVRGFITGVIALKPLFDSVLRGKNVGLLHARVIDISDEHTIIYQSAEVPEVSQQSLFFESDMQVFGRTWKVQYWLAADYNFANADYLAFAVLTVGLLFTAVLGAFLLVVTGRAHHVNQLVTKRSAELKGVLDNALDTILTFDASGRITSINPAGEHLLHVKARDILQHNISKLLPAINAELYSQDNSGNEQHVRFDTIALTAAGDEIPVELAMSKMHINNEHSYMLILHDLIERNKAEKLKDDIISTVSHELRTPLTSIVGSLGLVNGGVAGQLPEQAASLIDLALQNSQRLKAMVNDILELSKQQAEGYSLSLMPLALTDFLNSVVKLNAGYASQYQVLLQLDAPELQLNVMADEAKLMQVFSNLLSNAIKYSPTNGTVHISCGLPDSEHVDIAVRDEGNGIPEEFHQFIFRRFSQADSTDTRRVGGTGLGLAIAKIIVEKHQGDIWFDTEQGKGTTFFVRLPLTEEHINDVEPV